MTNFIENRPVQAFVEPIVPIVPYWIRQAAKYNHLSTLDLFNYERLRELISIEDLASFIIVNTSNFYQLEPEIHPIQTHEWMFDFKSISPSLKQEYEALSWNMVYDERRKKEVTDRLMLDPGQPLDPGGKYYDIEVSPNNAVVIFALKGFLNLFDNDVLTLNFLEDFLKAYYSLVPIPEVSRTRAFRAYLDRLYANMKQISLPPTPDLAIPVAG